MNGLLLSLLHELLTIHRTKLCCSRIEVGNPSACVQFLSRFYPRGSPPNAACVALLRVRRSSCKFSLYPDYGRRGKTAGEAQARGTGEVNSSISVSAVDGSMTRCS